MIHPKIRLTNFLLLLAIIVTNISCSKVRDRILYEYEVTDSIKINDENHGMYYLNIVDNNFISIDLYDRIGIILFNKKGEILDCYNNKGKGPEELLRAEHLSIYHNKIYALDTENSKIIILSLRNNQLKYDSEFKINETAATLCAIDDNTILVSNISNFENLSVYNYEGELIHAYAVNSKEETTCLEDFLSRMNIISCLDDAAIVCLGNVISGKLTFAQFNTINDSLFVFKETFTEQKVMQSIEVAQKDDDLKVNVNGLRDIQSYGGRWYVLMSNPHPENSFEIYNSRGNFEGRVKVYNAKDEILSFCFSNDPDTLFLILDERPGTVYVASRK